MEVEYSGGGVLIFSYLILIHHFDDLGGLCDNFGSDFIRSRFDGPPIPFVRSKLSQGSLIRVNSLAAALMSRQ